MKNILLLCSCFLPVLGGSQPLSEIPYPYKLEAAEESYAKRDYYNAVDWYEQCYQETREMELAIKIADCHHKLRDYRRAERWYRRIVQKDVENNKPEAKYIFGLLLKMNGNYDEAEKVLNQVILEQPDNELGSKAKLELDGINLAKSIKRRDDLLVESVGRNVNTRYTESSPALDAEGNLYYVTFDTDEVILVKEDNTDYHARVFETQKNNRGVWERGSEFNEKMIRILRKRKMKYKYLKEWSCLMIHKGDLKVDLDGINFLYKGPKNFKSFNFEGIKIKCLSQEGLLSIYKASIKISDEPETRRCSCAKRARDRPCARVGRQRTRSRGWRHCEGIRESRLPSRLLRAQSRNHLPPTPIQETPGGVK